ncbi:hypothetical protein [Actinacidiphila bryophytorum]|uniref:Mce-associated membrane protein n=1 Tax=Actinacidiphila bryophytorum TaxID=1436133 RepID=A0A9W4EDJ8_9ACTN|nr:hypothetical protein [Actinacidiphila bryophytorum]MBM9434860.1 hypothetical protein [Actinacidiphila bryophytorum]MBN6544354.1 hypothetical protein [Actinacidiphila bryophytorum]CAG7630927.1 hypothetical protein SBRY_20720 [Actinacidiphila bryophytorum]
MKTKTPLGEDTAAEAPPPAAGGDVPARDGAGAGAAAGPPAAGDAPAPDGAETARPADEPASDAAPAPSAADGDPAEEADRSRRRLPWPGVLRGRRPALPRAVRANPLRAAAVAGIALLLLAGGGLGYAAQQLKDPGAARNHALTDTEATSRLTGDVSDALSRIFAYTPDDTQTTAQAARDLLEGAAAQQYQTLFTQIRQQVADQRLTLSTRVVRAGVVSLTGDRARLLVFLDQTAQRAGDTATTAAAQLSVSAHLVGGHWRISDLKAR